MATTENTYTGNGSTTNYSFTFPYLSESDVRVSLDDIDQPTTAYSFANATTISFGTAPANGVAIRIYRQTAQDTPPATFFAGSAIRAQDLNENFLQQLYVAQETDNIARNLTAGDIAPGSITNDLLASNSVTSGKIVDGTIVDADISGTAEIAVSKLADGNARQLLQTDAAGTGVEWTSNVDVPGTLDVTGAATFDSTVTATGAATFDSTVTATGAATFNNTVTATGNVNVPSLNGGPLGGTRNLLINGALTINQRGYVSGTPTTTANQYTVDRWRVVASGESLTFTSLFGAINATAPAYGVEQVIEGANVMAGTYTLSWIGNATAEIKIGSGSFSNVSNGGQVQVPLPGGSDVTVRFYGPGTFSLPQFEFGTGKTPFERRNYGLELALCQRYYEYGGTQLIATGQAGSAFSTTSAFKVTKRAVPTMSFFNTALTNASGIASNTASIHFANIYTTGSATSTVSLTTDYAASAEL